MHITIVCVPYHIDVSRWGCAQGPQAFLDHGLIQLLEARGGTPSLGGGEFSLLSYPLDSPFRHSA
jgi:hypothetical protein